jgi:hypothetical protein
MKNPCQNKKIPDYIVMALALSAFFAPNLSLIPPKPTGIGLQDFLYCNSNQSDYLRNELIINEGEDG